MVKLLLRPYLTDSNGSAEEAVASPGIAAMSKLLEPQVSVKRPKEFKEFKEFKEDHRR